LTQEVFLQVHRRISTLRNYAALKSWLYRVTMNAILMHFRKRDLLAMSLHYVQDPKTLAVLDIAETLVTRGCEPIERVALARAIGRLPKCRRVMVLLHDIKGLSHREIAESLGISLTTAKSNLSRARRQLRGALFHHSSVTRTRSSVHPGVYDTHDDFNWRIAEPNRHSRSQIRGHREEPIGNSEEELFRQAKQEVTPGLYYNSFSLPSIQHSTRREDGDVGGVGKLFICEIEASSTRNLMAKPTGKRRQDLCKSLFGCVGN
jgi:RNA polymerase sigma factor (sigma-70 family)